MDSDTESVPLAERAAGVRGAFPPGGLRLRLPRFGTARRSLRLNIGVAFSLLIVLLGTALISFAHERHRRIALLTAGTLFERSTAQLAADASALYAPAETLVNLTATLAAEMPSFVDDRAVLLVHLAGALREHPHLEAAFVGEADGDFFLLRNVYDVPGERTLGASLPGGTRYLAQSVERDGDGERYEHVFLDVDLARLGASEDFVTGYDPRTRDWYRLASASDSLVHTDFYTFFTSRETGTTVARRIGEGGAVFGVDITLESVSAALRALSPSPAAEIVVFTVDGKLLGSNDAGRLQDADRVNRRPGTGIRIGDVDEPVLDELFHRFVEGERDAVLDLEAGGESWFASVRPVRFGAGGERAFMAIAVPERDMLSALARVRLQSAGLALVALVAALAFAWYLSGSISASAARLAGEAREMARLRFGSPITVRSRIAEIDELARSMAVMKSALQRFTRVAATLSAEEGSDGVARVALAEARAVSGAGVARLMLLSDDGTRLVAFEPVAAGDGAPRPDEVRPTDVPLAATDDEGERRPPEAMAMTSGRTVIVDADPASGPGEASAAVWGRGASRLVVPLKAGGETPIGVLQLGMVDGSDTPLRSDEESIRFVESLATAATVALRNRQLIEAQHATFESLIRLLAKAIDAKSPYTGGHCQRVPVLVERLARAASASTEPAFRDFRLDERRARELHVASWLHDCGKVTTPEHLVDKATKLEGVFDRIHEIRTRFEVLHRDAEIEFLQSVDGVPEEERAKARTTLARRHEALRADFAFVAECNVGTESMSDDRVDRLAHIARRTWTRRFDDTLGLSSAERARKRLHGSRPPPAIEPLLADRPEHRIPRHASPDPAERARHGFTDPVPEHEHDAGELHNLTIRYGTLTAEERHRINDHVVQTILMLEDVPFPRELARVPRIAGNHHEKLDGSGFPRGLRAEALEIEDRIMTVADVFEALTARDRPYKRAKTLSESLAIMRAMAGAGKIDGALLALFAASGIPEAYAREHLSAEQIDLPLAGAPPATSDIEESATDER